MSISIEEIRKRRCKRSTSGLWLNTITADATNQESTPLNASRPLVSAIRERYRIETSSDITLTKKSGKRISSNSSKQHSSIQPETCYCVEAPEFKTANNRELSSCEVYSLLNNIDEWKKCCSQVWINRLRQAVGLYLTKEQNEMFDVSANQLHFGWYTHPLGNKKLSVQEKEALQLLSCVITMAQSTPVLSRMQENGSSYLMKSEVSPLAASDNEFSGSQFSSVTYPLALFFARHLEVSQRPLILMDTTAFRDVANDKTCDPPVWRPSVMYGILVPLLECIPHSGTDSEKSASPYLAKILLRGSDTDSLFPSVTNETHISDSTVLEQIIVLFNSVTVGCCQEPNIFWLSTNATLPTFNDVTCVPKKNTDLIDTAKIARSGSIKSKFKPTVYNRKEKKIQNQIMGQLVTPGFHLTLEQICIAALKTHE